MATIKDKISYELRKKVKEELKTDEFAIVNADHIFSIEDLEQSRYEDTLKKNKRKKNRLIDIEPISTDLVNNISYKITYDFKKKYLKTNEKTGMFKLTFSDGCFIFVAKYPSGQGSQECIKSMWATTRENWIKFFHYSKEVKRVSGKPKLGIFRATLIQTIFGTKFHYEKIKKINQTPVFHQNESEIFKDIEFFRNNPEIFNRWDAPYSRKCLLVGEPGTGKSSIGYKVAKKYEKSMCVVFATALQEAAAHMKIAAKYKVPTIIILEDADSSFGWSGSSVLNFLDGIDQPKNPAGTYILMTTNYPQAIEPRILQRPGRIDKIIHIGALDEKNAILASRVYFENILFDKTQSEKEREGILKELYQKIIAVGKGMTGAQIKGLASNVKSFAISNAISDITVDVVLKTKEHMEKTMKDVYELASENSMLGREALGFKVSSDSDKSKKDEFNWTEINKAIEQDLPF